MGTASSTGSNPPSRMGGVGSPIQTTYQSSYRNNGRGNGQQGGPNHGYSTYTGPGYEDRVNASHGTGQYYGGESVHYPPQQPPQSPQSMGAPPPIGFTPDVVHGGSVRRASEPYQHQPQQTNLYPTQELDPINAMYGQDLSPQDCSSDIVLSRLMAAEEFLQHMEETDRRIQVMSEVTDRDTVYEQLTEALGLRGHMQDELLRILAMLVQDSPDLDCLDEFEDSFPNVVNRLRDLQEKAKVIKALSKTRAASAFGQRSVGEDLDPSLIDLDPSLLRTMEAKLEEVDIVAAQAESSASQNQKDTANVTEGDLKVKHQVILETDDIILNEVTQEEIFEEEMMSMDEIFLQEEHAVSSNFANRVLEAGTAGPQAVDRLLHEHAISMQALRDRQNVERQRVMSAAPSRHRSSQGTGTSTSSAGQAVQTDNVKTIQKSYVADINFGADGKMTVVTPGEGGGKKTKGSSPRGKPVGTAAVIRQSPQSRDAKGISKDLGSDDELDDLITAATSVQTSIAVNDEFGEYGSSDSDVEQNVALLNYVPKKMDPQEANELRQTFTKDMWERRKTMTTEDFRSILSDFRSQEEERKRLRQLEMEKHKNSMKAKVADSKRKKQHSMTSETAESEPQETPEVKAGGTKNGGNAAEYESFRRDADKEDEEARRIRDLEKQRMKQKLQDKLKNKKNAANDSVEELTAEIDEVVEQKDAAFVAELRRRGMSQIDIDELLRRHLLEAEEIRRRKFAERSRLDERLREILGNKNKKNLEEMDDDVHEDLATLDAELARKVRGRPDITAGDVDELLAEHRRQQEQLLRARAVQRDRLDERLKAKLKKPSTLMEDEEQIEDDDQFFDQLQRLQKSGELSQDAFQEMLRQYLSNVDNQRKNELKEQRRRLREEEKLREREAQAAEKTASTLVTEHQEQTKQLQNTRQRERRALDARLQEKLKQSKKQKETAAEEDLYDF